MAEIDYAAEASAGLMMYGLPSSLSEDEICRDHIEVCWKSDLNYVYNTVIISGDRYGSLLQDVLGHELETIGELRLHFARPQQHRREHIIIGNIIYSAPISTLFVNMNKTSFEQAGFDFLGDLFPPHSLVQRVIYLQTKSVNSSFLSRKLPHGVLRATSSYSDSVLEALDGFQQFPQGYFLHSMSAAILNFSQVSRISSTVLQYDVDKEDLPSCAAALYKVVKVLASFYRFELPEKLDVEVYKIWRKNVSVDGTAHLYM